MSQRKLAKNISVMSIAIMLSRVLGLVRDQVMAYFFGNNYLNDAFNIAYNIPNLLRRLFGEGALSAAFVPIYNDIGIKEGRGKQVSFALNVLSLLTLFLAALTFLGIVFAPLIVKALYPGLPDNTTFFAIRLSRIIFPYLFFIGLSSTMIAILNSHDVFFLTGLSSALLNLGMMAGVLIPFWIWDLRGEQLIYWAGWGVFVGGFLQTLINLPWLKRFGYSLRLIISFSGEALSALWKRFIPSMIGIGIREINLIADAVMASFLAVGSITALSFGNRLMQLPLGIFAISTGTALLPMFSRQVTGKKYDELSANLRFASTSLACLILPITLIICLLGKDFVMLLFQHGEFDARATLMTTQALFYYSLGLIFYSLNQTITPLFYANKDTKTPVVIAAWMVGLNIVLNLILMLLMQHRGLALSTSITAMVNYALLLHLLKKKMPEVRLKGLATNLIKPLVICLVLALPLHYLNSFFVYQSKLALGIKALVFSTAVFGIFYLLAHLARVEYISTLHKNLWSRLLKR